MDISSTVATNSNLNPKAEIYIPVHLESTRNEKRGNVSQPASLYYTFCFLVFLFILLLFLFLNVINNDSDEFSLLDMDYPYALEDSDHELSPISLEENDSHFSDFSEPGIHSTLDLTPVPVNLKPP